MPERTISIFSVLGTSIFGERLSSVISDEFGQFCLLGYFLQGFRRYFLKVTDYNYNYFAKKVICNRLQITFQNFCYICAFSEWGPSLRAIKCLPMQGYLWGEDRFPNFRPPQVEAYFSRIHSYNSTNRNLALEKKVVNQSTWNFQGVIQTLVGLTMEF